MFPIPYSLLHDSWHKHLKPEFEKPYFVELKKFLDNEITEGKKIYPHPSQFFAAFNATPFEKVRVVILGQDPYHGENQAHGLSFSVPKTQKTMPPSLKNIFKEIGIQNPCHGNLEHWAEQGVFLLNSILSVEAAKPKSHEKKGWEVFTNTVIKTLSDNRQGIIFLFWGDAAIAKRNMIDETKHIVFTAHHPSPLSAYRGFLGCGHFEKTNEILKKRGEKIIEWEKK